MTSNVVDFPAGANMNGAAASVTNMNGVSPTGATTNGVSPTGATTNGVSPTGATVSFERGDEVEIAQRLLHDLRAHGELTVDEGGLWQYDARRGVWVLRSPDEIAVGIAGYAGSPVVTPTSKLLRLSRSAIVGAGKLAVSLVATDMNRHQFCNGCGGVAFANGFVVVSGGQIRCEPHAPSHSARHAFDFPYDPNAPHPQLDQFLAEVFADAYPVDAAERATLLQEFAGVSLIGQATTYQKALIAVGEGGTGKSAMLTIIGAIFPADATCALPPQDWGSRFRTAGLVGKLANIVNEINEGEIVANAIFKSVITGEPVTGEQKNQAPFTFRPMAGHFFSTNSLPATIDFTSGFWRRFMVVPLTRNMRQAPTHRPNVADAIIKAELPGIVAWALEGARRVQVQNGFSRSQASDWMLSQWRSEADPVLLFVQTECASGTTFTKSPELYRAYSNWARDNGFMKMASTKFYKRMKLTGNQAVHTSTGNGYYLSVRNPKWLATP